MMLSKRMTAKRRELKPASQARKRMVKESRDCQPAGCDSPPDSPAGAGLGAAPPAALCAHWAPGPCRLFPRAMRPLHGDELRDDLCLLSGAEGSAMLCPGGGSRSAPPPPPGARGAGRGPRGGGGGGRMRRGRREERGARPPSAPRGQKTGGGGGGGESPPQQWSRPPLSQLGWPLRPSSHPSPQCSCGNGES
uniref:Uncharacterized protein n=1 Tax=Ovis aries TaxID=9940 RepID=A0AC11DJ58_SHEEP